MSDVSWQDNVPLPSEQLNAALNHYRPQVHVLVTHYKRLIRDASLPDLRFHDLRHTRATLLLGQGVHPKIVQERLGYADIAMTLNRSSYVTPDMQRMAADTLDAAFRDAG